MVTNLRILGKIYTVSEYEDLPLGERLFGFCDDMNQTIKVCKSLPLENKQDTLLHEAIHALDFAIKTKLTEEQVSALATGLLCLFKDNPDFMEWLNGPKRRNPKKT